MHCSVLAEGRANLRVPREDAAAPGGCSLANRSRRTKRRTPRGAPPPGLGTAPWNGSVSSPKQQHGCRAGVGHIAPCTRKMLPGLPPQRATAPQSLRGESVARSREKEGSQQSQDTSSPQALSRHGSRGIPLRCRQRLGQNPRGSAARSRFLRTPTAISRSVKSTLHSLVRPAPECLLRGENST